MVLPEKAVTPSRLPGYGFSSFLCRFPFMMKSPAAIPLSGRQMAGIAFSILLIYWPIRFYQNVSPMAWATAILELPFFLVEIGLTFLFFWGWVGLTDTLLG